MLIAEENKGGSSMASLAKKYGTNPTTVKNTFRRIGHDPYLHKAGGRPKRWSRESIDDIIFRYRKLGHTQQKIASDIGTSQGQVSKILYAWGDWNGEPQRRRKILLHGYEAVLISRDDEMSSMRMYNGYVLMHRLVMARHIGRPLRKDETVHHINGEKLDNRIENLQLRQGKHGRGVSHRCLDCNSINVAPYEIQDH